jgi:hypothetical protein
MNHPFLEMLGRFPWSTGTLISLALVFGLGLWLAAERRTLALQRVVAVEGLYRELREAGLVPVRWSMESVMLSGQHAAQVEEQLERWRQSIAAELPVDGGPDEPRDRSGAFFVLEEFRARMRARAGELGTGLRRNEEFGFASHVHEGPEDRLIGSVHRQCQLIELFLTTLFREPPIELRSVQRERPAPMTVADVAATAGTAGGAPEDFFTVDPRISARVPGLIDSIGVRLVFVGRTATLRSFLAGIGGYGLPLIVRCVEVEGAGPLQTAVRPPEGEDWEGLSQFTIIVEHVKLAKPAL